MSRLRNMRIVEIPAFRAVSSGEGTLDEIFSPGGFDEWIGAHGDLILPSLYEPNNFLWHEDNDIDRSVLIYPVSGMCNMPAGGSEMDRRMGIAQQQIFLPLKYRNE